jgi:preprotein translocase subunit Sss1
MENFSSPASIQTGLDKILTFFQENNRIFQKILKLISKNSKSEYAEVVKHVLAKFQLSSFYPDGLRHFVTFLHVHAKVQLSSFYPNGLRQIFDHFSGELRNFLKKISKFSNSEKSSK